MNIQQMSDRELYEYCRFVGAKARMWKRRFVALLPEVSRRGLHRKKGFATIVEFAAKVGGIGKKTVEAVFQVEKHICDKPFFKKILPEVGVDKVRVIATIATKENQKDLAEKVKTMSKPALELFARAMREEPKYAANEGFVSISSREEERTDEFQCGRRNRVSAAKIQTTIGKRKERGG